MQARVQRQNSHDHVRSSRKKRHHDNGIQRAPTICDKTRTRCFHGVRSRSVDSDEAQTGPAKSGWLGQVANQQLLRSLDGIIFDDGSSEHSWGLYKLGKEKATSLKLMESQYTKAASRDLEAVARHAVAFGISQPLRNDGVREMLRTANLKSPLHIRTSTKHLFLLATVTQTEAPHNNSLIGLFYLSMSFLSRLIRPFSMSAAPAAPMDVPTGAQTATLAAGCFWGVEHMYRRAFGNKGLLDARVGYIGGDTQNPSYRAVCSGRTGHTEALQVVFDPEQVTYRTLLEYFYKMHDPTTANRQGPDVGSQYRSAIFYHNEEQEKIAKEVTDKVNKQWWKGAVRTEVLPAGQWWDAETYHQLYLDKNPSGYECPSHFLRKFPPLED